MYFQAKNSEVVLNGYLVDSTTKCKSQGLKLFIKTSIGVL